MVRSFYPPPPPLPRQLVMVSSHTYSDRPPTDHALWARQEASVARYLEAQAPPLTALGAGGGGAGDAAGGATGAVPEAASSSLDRGGGAPPAAGTGHWE